MAPIGRFPDILCFLALAAAARTAGGQTLAASLAEYHAATPVVSVPTSAKSFSGAAFHPETRTLYVIDNDNASVYELETAGNLLRNIATTGFTDPEGIAYQADDWFLIAEEGLADVVRVKLPRTGTGPVAKPGSGALSLGADMSNSGIEGVAYRASDKAAFAVKEVNPPRLYRLTLDAAGNPTAFQADAPFDIGGKSGDAADIAAPEDGGFILVNQEGNKLEGYGPEGQALSSLPLGLKKPEGVAVDAATGTLYVVGEPAEFRVFKRAATAARSAPSVGVSETSGDFSVTLAHDPRHAPGAGTGRELRFQLPAPCNVRIDHATAAGGWTRVFQGGMGPGSHAVALPAPEPGIGFYRFSAGDFQRVLMQVSAP